MIDKSEAISATKEYFLDLLHMFGVFLTSGYSIPPQFACDRYAYQRYCERWERVERNRILYDLRKQKLMKLEERGDEVIVELTQKGRTEALKQKILCEKKELSKGNVCLVGFDIPEYTRKTRSVFRQFLKKVGFKQLHQSVWYSELDLVVPLCELIKQLDIEKWVVVFKAEITSSDLSFDPAVPKDRSV